MPDSPELFVESVGFNSYGHRACTPSTPKQHIYNWMSARPVVKDDAIERYAVDQQHPKLIVEDLLVIIGQMIQTWTVGYLLPRLEALPDRSHIYDELLCIGVDMVTAAFCVDLALAVADFIHIKNVICRRITTHLDDERDRKENTLELADEIVRSRSPDVHYGILFSFFHCVIVKVYPDGNFDSTLALQFVPSFYTASPSTPGITAIARLAYHSTTTIADTDDPPNLLPVEHILNQVPKDVSIVPGFKGAADAILLYPHIRDYRLIEAIGWDGEEEGRSEPHSSKDGIPNPVPASRRFSAMREGSAVPVLTLAVFRPLNIEFKFGNIATAVQTRYLVTQICSSLVSPMELGRDLAETTLENHRFKNS
ncbi:hypothetical protein C8R44DRAFT_741473 [Mycena epipterygia]|nr:hypothetical protein C8R44DRAFT_741473 [Mycena epipterygia]